jgi:hypothetical protein
VYVFLNTLNRTFLCQIVALAVYNQGVSSMAKKLEIVKETAAAASARAAKPKTPRVKTAQHSKAASIEQVVTQALSDPASPESTDSDHPHDAIARIAYSLWEARGCQSGSALEDWELAEREYRQRLAATRL